MSVTRATFNIHRHMQYLTPLPYIPDKKVMAYVSNPKFPLRHHKLFRCFMQLLITIIFVVMTYRMYWFFLNWKTYGSSHLGECVIYFIGWNLIILQTVFCYRVIQKHETYYTASQKGLQNLLRKKPQTVKWISLHYRVCMD